MTLASAPRLQIQLCGATIVERDGERLEPQLPGRQGRLLFAYLVINRDHATGRDRLADALWPEPVPASAAAGLNPLLSKLRRILGADAGRGPIERALAAADRQQRRCGESCGGGPPGRVEGRSR